MKANLVFYLLLTGLYACHKQEDNVLDSSGVAVKLPALWKTSISDDGELAQVSIDAAISPGANLVLAAGQKNKHRSLIALDGRIGTKVWEWDDLLSLIQDPTYKDPITVYSNGYYIKDNALFIPFSTSNYCLDIRTGTTIWKKQIALSRVGICYGMGDVVFYAGSPYYAHSDESVYTRSVKAGDSDRLVATPDYEHQPGTDPYWTGHITGCLPFMSATGDTLLSIFYLDPYDIVAHSTSTALGLYNVSSRQWVYTRKVIIPKRNVGDFSMDNSNIIFPILYQGKIYCATGHGLACFDPLTGTAVWQRLHDQGFSSFIIADNKLIANCEDTYTYCLDPATGYQLWNEKSSGTCTPISYLNGVVYFSGGGDGKLHALDATTGQHLWKLKSPDETINSGAWFYGVCVAVPGKDGGKGRVVATTGLNAYGYEAIR